MRSCGKPFSFRENNLGMPGTKEKEPIECPYSGCGHTIQRTANGIWETSGLTEKQQSDFLAGRNI